ncbi:hypothetical protein DOY81_010452 [Sarcophaga bullata]|nr:hypothetical protein DOY81_010452 [Sarcophaga bullata]
MVAAPTVLVRAAALAPSATAAAEDELAVFVSSIVTICKNFFQNVYKLIKIL